MKKYLGLVLGMIFQIDIKMTNNDQTTKKKEAGILLAQSQQWKQNMFKVNNKDT